MALELTPDVIIEITQSLLQFALAGLLLYLNFNHTANRLLSLLLVVRGLAFFTGAMSEATAAPVDVAFWGALLPYFAIALAVGVWGFAAVYPRPRFPRVPGGAVTVATLTFTGILGLAYLGDHSRWLQAPGEPGPLGHATAFLFVSFPLAAALFLRDALAMPHGRTRGSLLIMSMGFSLVQLNDVITASITVWRTGSSPWTDGIYTLAPLLVTLVAHAAVAVQLVRALWSGEHARDRGLVAYLILVGVSAASGAAVALGGSQALASLMEAVWNTALPLLVTYALLRHQLFDIDLRVKWTIKQSTVAAAFIGVFFVVSEGAAAAFESTTGSTTVGILAAGALVFAIAPLQRLAERVANAAMPGVRAADELGPTERQRVYRDQARAAWRDGAIDRSERVLLDRLRESLGLSLDEAMAIEREAGEVDG